MESASPSPPTDCTVWIPAAEWPRVQTVFEAMNNAEPVWPGLRIPAETLPVEVFVDENGDAAYSCESTSIAHDIVGESTGYDIFGEPGWTLEKFTLFMTSRKHMYSESENGKSPTLAALAGYWQTPFLVDTAQNDSHFVYLVTPDGNVTIVEYDGGQDGMLSLRETFFVRGLEAALALPGVTLRKAGPRPLPGVDSFAANRQGLLHDWVTAHDLGRMSAPQGAELCANDLLFPHRDEINTHRPVVAYVRSAQHLYELLYPVTQELGPLELLCAVDGVLQRYVDPETGAEQGLGALATDWADWILEDSVPEGHRRPKQPWEGNSLDARLYRLEHHIVDYDDQETGTSQFVTALELETWLKSALGRHNLPISVDVLNDAALLLKAGTMPVFQQHTYERSEGPELKVRKSKQFFSPWAGFRTWEHPDTGRHLFQPYLNTVMDGEKVESFHAVSCLDFDELEPYLLPSGATVDMQSWFVLSVRDTRTCILFPAAGTMLKVSTDNDGAAARITAREYQGRRRELDRERAFHTRWADWLDADHQLTHQEILAGMDTLDRMIKENSK
ncbi:MULTISPECIES: hypothetical protein [unclassified Arthrobacter]|uniref:hypothetical protein n=1 Tax=unclassified Arthrobacter TaxID=235627 RepID=UPI002107E485|nr:MULTISPECIES: hypothetical protein [unclassified Arthrobacter]MCQ1947560.1 hypothetical protein [Arthrobacter sp. zg-Y1116]MCQ1996856.1 hypothetical protein [Arthrobacter sp. zg-Y1171]UWX82444.1 hypothetical protein N2L00_03155 [Arthrobacter sp. zg-Y1171]